MKSRLLIAMSVFCLIAALGVSIPLCAQQGHSQGPSYYKVIDLGTLGGTASSGNTINNLGWVMGSSNKTGDAIQLATLWLYGLQIPLGTLGGPSSDIGWPVKNNFGLIAGVSENGTPDPQNESFSCPVFGLVSGNSCVAFAWQFGRMTQLPGLGGNNSIGAGDNDQGQIVGWAENKTEDPTCNGGQIYQFEAVVWNRSDGKWKVRQLPPYGADPDSAATAINGLGQVVGISGRCGDAIGAYSAIHPLLWQDGKPIDLGNLGGSGWNTPTAINNLGVVVGFANGPNDVINGKLQIRFLAFRWTKEGGMVSLGTLPGLNGTPDAMSEATDVNDEDQVVGVSYQDFGFDGPRAFVYQNGMMTDLNQLIPKSANLYLSSTGGINNRGEIAAQANVVSNGLVTSVLHAVLLVPTFDRGDAATVSGDAPKVTIPADVLQQMKRRIGNGRFIAPGKPE